MSYFLFLDDERKPSDVTWVDLPPRPWVIVRSFNQFVDVITQRGIPLEVSFDHDLADEHYPSQEMIMDLPETLPYETYSEKTGYEAAKWLVQQVLDRGVEMPTCFIHTMNPVGQKNIKAALADFDKALEFLKGCSFRDSMIINP